MNTCDVVIIGAGPYGLSAAAHLRTIKGLELRIFGDPMSFWERSMPAGMYLRSAWSATHIADPESSFTLEAYQSASGSRFAKPVPLEHFVQYGLWFQRQAAPEVDRRQVALVEPGQNGSKGFRLTLQDGEVIHSCRVIVACGILPFASRPAKFLSLPASLATHTSEHRDFGRFAGKRVMVIGGGQSALESAALLHEAGADVEVFARTHQIHWLQGFASTTLHWRLGKFTKQLLYAPTDVGPAGVSQLVARPDLLKRLPRSIQRRLWKRSVRPAGARWLVDRLREVPITLGRSVEAVAARGNRVTVRFDDGLYREAHHVLLGTGFRVDLSKYGFLSPALLESIRCVAGFPCLGPGLETSAPGLHILGAPAASSFGPLMQFVSGARYTSRSLVRSITGRGHKSSDSWFVVSGSSKNSDSSLAVSGVKA